MKRYQQTAHALGSTAYATLVSELDESRVAAIFEKFWQTVTAFEQRFSRFLPDSELTAFNRRAGEQVVVSPAFAALLAEAKHWADASGGLYNPLVLPALQSAGYLGSWPQPARGAEYTDFRGRKLAPADAIVLAEHTASIPVDAAVDFGGIGKGYLLGQLGEFLRREGVANFWLSLGGDVLCAGFDLHGKPWNIAVQRADDPAHNVATIASVNGEPLAIATSGITKRRGVHGGRAWHHLIDPKNGQPARTDILTATVACADATAADVLAKCLVLAGTAGARELAEHHQLRATVLQTGQFDDAPRVRQITLTGEAERV